MYALPVSGALSAGAGIGLSWNLPIKGNPLPLGRGRQLKVFASRTARCPGAVLFNGLPQSAGLEKHPRVPMLFPRNGSALKRGGWLNQARADA